MKKLIFFLTTLITIAASAQDKPEGLFINSKAPDFSIKDQNGKMVSLKELRKKGPIVIVFYRGNWCPYCNKELKNLQDSLELITAKNAQVIAITPEAAEGITKTVEKTGAKFPILYDADAKLAKAYQVAFDVDEKTAKRYKSFDIDLLAINKQKDVPVLPVPAVYIVNKDGSVTYRYFEADYKRRVSVRELLEQIK